MPNDLQGYVAGGPNPHFKPPLMRWNQVEIIAPVGIEFGILYDSDGLLSIVLRLPDSKWPSGYEPTGLTNLIQPGDKSYRIENKERMAAVGHEFTAHPDSPGKCLLCEADIPHTV